MLAVVTKKDVAFSSSKRLARASRGRSGGYARIFKLAKVRQGDAAPMAVISLLGENEQVKTPTKPTVVASGS